MLFLYESVVLRKSLIERERERFFVTTFTALVIVVYLQTRVFKSFLLYIILFTGENNISVGEERREEEGNYYVQV